jgi:hypothetical protein
LIGTTRAVTPARALSLARASCRSPSPPMARTVSAPEAAELTRPPGRAAPSWTCCRGWRTPVRSRFDRSRPRPAFRPAAPQLPRGSPRRCQPDRVPPARVAARARSPPTRRPGRSRRRARGSTRRHASAGGRIPTYGDCCHGRFLPVPPAGEGPSTPTGDAGQHVFRGLRPPQTTPGRRPDECPSHPRPNGGDAGAACTPPLPRRSGGQVGGGAEPDSRSIAPFDQLTPRVQAMDAPFVEAIHQVARERSGVGARQAGLPGVGLVPDARRYRAAAATGLPSPS